MTTPILIMKNDGKGMIQPVDFFTLLSDETRLRCLSLLQQQGELCVCELTEALNLSQPKISRHLALLRKHNMVSDRRAGIWVYYRLHPELPQWMQAVLTTTVQAIKHLEPYASESQKLVSCLPNRATCCR